jgi:hypothetical protein
VVIDVDSKECPCCGGRTASDRRDPHGDAGHHGGAAAGESHPTSALWVPRLLPALELPPSILSAIGDAFVEEIGRPELAGRGCSATKNERPAQSSAGVLGDLSSGAGPRSQPRSGPGCIPCGRDAAFSASPFGRALRLAPKLLREPLQRGSRIADVRPVAFVPNAPRAQIIPT